MNDLADLKERFDFAAIWFLERSDKMHGVEASLPDKDAKAVEILKSLRDSVDAIPPSLIRTAEALRTDAPEAFEKWLVHGVQAVGFGFYPESATEFVQALNNTVQKDLASARASISSESKLNEWVGRYAHLK
jgi:hypothetical protein